MKRVNLNKKERERAKVITEIIRAYYRSRSHSIPMIDSVVEMTLEWNKAASKGDPR